MITAEILGKTLIEMCEKGDVDKSLNLFLDFVDGRGLSHMLPNVLLYLEQVSKGEREKALVVITTARKVPEDVLVSIKKYIRAHGNTTERIDESLIGGFTAKTEGLLYDASVSNSLLRLKQGLSH